MKNQRLLELLDDATTDELNELVELGVISVNEHESDGGRTK